MSEYILQCELCGRRFNAGEDGKEKMKFCGMRCAKSACAVFDDKEVACKNSVIGDFV